jgi:hypothetical protein
MEYVRKGVALADKAGDKKAQPAFYEMKGRIYWILSAPIKKCRLNV